MATLRRRAAKPSERFTLDDLGRWIKAGNSMFPAGYSTGVTGGQVERTENSFQGYIDGIYKRNGVVFSCMAIRQAIFSEVTFKFRSVNKGKPGDLFGDSSLSLLEQPWPNGTTGELAARMIQDTDLAGNFYAVARGGRLYRRRPDRMEIVLDGNPAEDEFVNIVGYVYRPQGRHGQQFTYLPGEVCHWTPLPDPGAEYMGMSWLTPILREIEADGAATDHKSKFFRNGATPPFAVTLPEDVMTTEQFEDFRNKMINAHSGVDNAYKTLYLAPGADVKPVGADLKQLSFDDTQGRDETRIAAAAGVPAVLAGIKESLQGSSLNAGNYLQARRRLADVTMRPLYRSASSALQSLCPPPANDGSHLWYDDSDIAFFREDRADAAEIESTKATTIRTLVDAGYKPETVVAAVEAEDMNLLVHSGMFSVQLQPPGAMSPAPAPGA